MAKDADNKNNMIRQGAAPKRAASGKIRRPENEEAKKDSAKKDSAEERDAIPKYEGSIEDELGPAPVKTVHKPRTKKKTARDVAVSVFAVVFVLSMMIPSLASIIMGASKTNGESETITADQVDGMYASQADELEKKLKENPDDTAALADLGDLYLTWASTTSSFIATDEGKAHSEELYDKARDCFNHQLELEDNSEAKVNLALCDLYSGKADEAQKSLEDIVANDDQCAKAWLNLGFIKETTDKNAAKDYYQHAIDTDPNGDKGAKEIAQSRLDAMKQAEEGEKSGDAATTDATNTEDSGQAEATDAASGDAAQATDANN